MDTIRCCQCGESTTVTPDEAARSGLDKPYVLFHGECFAALHKRLSRFVRAGETFSAESIENITVDELLRREHRSKEPN